jgi:hypothetical protein
MTKLEIYIELFKNHHVLHFNKKLVVTNKFHRDFSMEDMKQCVLRAQAEVQQLPAITPAEVPAVSFNFKKFIMDAQIPEKLTLSNGSFYWANRYSAPADKAFQKMMKRPGMRYDVLVIATKLYYQSGGARVTIANFMLEGTWESFYDTMLQELEQGTAEKHIKKNLSEGDTGFSRYS